MGFESSAFRMQGKKEKLSSKTILGDGWVYSEELKPSTKCKHGQIECDRCGTAARSDKLHTTVGGKGLVARLREKK